MTKYSRTMRGFTLVELLVVLGILGVIVTVTLVAVNPIAQIGRGRDTQRKSDLRQIQTALELVYQDTGSYPASVSFGSTGWGTYMAKVPQDKGGKQYFYRQTGSGTGYQMYASLDRGSTDQQSCAVTGCTGLTGTNCGAGHTCNFGVSSSNQTP